MLEDLDELLKGEPFSPFRIVLTSGGSYEVVSPLQVIVGRTKLEYFYRRSDRWAILRQNQIAAFEIQQERE